MKGPDGKMRGPWQAQRIVYLLNPETVDRYTFASGTTGGRIAINDLVERTKWMRKFRGAHVYPIVRLTDTFMNTRYGGRQRPHFQVLRWVILGGGGGGQPLPATEQPALAAPVTEQTSVASSMKTIEPPPNTETMRDFDPVLINHDQQIAGRPGQPSPFHPFGQKNERNMRRFVIYDIETRSELSLKLFGSYLYANHPSTEILCVSYGTVVHGIRGPISTWLPTEPVPTEILEAAANPDILFVAFNDAFERQIEQKILHPRYGWPRIPLERRRCAQAIALMHALPASLDAVAAALRFKTRKTKAGKRAMLKLAKPRKPRAGEDPAQIYWHNDPDDLEILYEYNRIDVEMTSEIVATLEFLPPHEQKIWELDAAINARGIHCDVPLLDAALKIAKEASAELNEKLAVLTEGEITSPAQTKRILTWLGQRKCALKNIQKGTTAEALARTDLPSEVRQLLELRSDGAHVAVNKLTTLRRWLSGEARIRQAFRYHGASSGRFTSIGVQMQNLKKPETEDVAAAIGAVRSGDLAQVQAYPRPLAIVGDITRALVTAAPEHRLFIADLSGIESRGLAWLADEQRKLNEWREFDRTGDPHLEPYYLFGARDLRLPDSVVRKTGKTCDLAFGYQGGIGAWRRLAPAGDTMSDDQVRANRRAWLRKHPNIKRFWQLTLRQAVRAIEGADDKEFPAGRITFRRNKSKFLHLELPSGRQLSYPYARVYADDHGKSSTFRDASGGRWEWYHLLKKRGAFGGLIAENATQAVCRDIFADAMLRLEATGYHVVAHLHDEFICEVPDGFGGLEEFLAIITTPPTWAPDFPIAAKGRIADHLIEIKEKAAAAETVQDAALDNAALADKNGTNGDDSHEISESDDELPDSELLEPEQQVEEPAAYTATKDPPPQPPPFEDMPPPEEDDPSPRANTGNGHADFSGFETHNRDDYTTWETPRGSPMVRYVYKDEHGKLYMRVIRTSAKSFPTQRWENGRWTTGWPAKAIPYRLPELLAATPETPIYICEGEKDTNNVAALGLVATTNPGGAGKWQPELAQWFKGKELVYILEDNDKAGRAHSAKVLTALKDIVPTIAVISFPELPEKGDVSDWLEAGGNRKAAAGAGGRGPQAR